MDVRDVGVALWRQRWLVALVVLLTGAAVAAGVALAPKSYTATATITAAELPDADRGEDPDSLRATLAELASSRSVVEQAGERITAVRSDDDLRRSVDGDWIRGTILVEINVEDRDPDSAAEIANAVADVLVEGTVTDGAAGSAIGDGLELAVSDPAEAPDSYSSPDLRLAIAVGLLVALGLATAAAVARDRRTHTIDDAAALEHVASAPLLAHLDPPRDLTVMPAMSPGTAEADQFRHLRVSTERARESGGTPWVVVAGITVEDVNVWIGANLALALAGTGGRVLLVDGRLGERFGTPVEDAPDTPGLYDVLLGADLDSAISPGPVDLLRVLPAGTYGDEPITELLARRFPTVMEAAAAEFDHVVVLGPALEMGDDSRVMAIDGSIVLAVVESTVSATALREHADRLRAVGARLLGVVLVGREVQRVRA